MRIHTSSEGVTLAKHLEMKTAQFYEEVAKQYLEIADAFRTFASENLKNVRHIEQTYFGVSSDAIEGGFCLDLEPDNFALDTTIPASSTCEHVLIQATQIEQSILAFYSTAGAQMTALMADLSQAFGQLAKKRQKRLLALSEILPGNISLAGEP